MNFKMQSEKHPKTVLEMHGLKASPATEKTPSVSSPGRHGRIGSLLVAFMLSFALLAASPTTVLADEYDEKNAGHPLRIIAYVLHPVGVVIDYLLLRPAHWIASHEPIQTLVGHED